MQPIPLGHDNFLHLSKKVNILTIDTTECRIRFVVTLNGVPAAIRSVATAVATLLLVMGAPLRPTKRGPRGPDGRPMSSFHDANSFSMLWSCWLRPTFALPLVWTVLWSMHCINTFQYRI